MQFFVSDCYRQKIQLNKYVSSKKDSNRTYFILQCVQFSPNLGAICAILNKLSKEQKIFRQNDFLPRKIFY